MGRNIVRCSEKEIDFNFGGKANSLLKLVNNNINVPKFFIISKSAYIKFLEYNNILIDNDYCNIKRKIDEALFPDELLAEIDDAWNEYNFSKVSVRSSAENEDGTTKSFAGQYETYLNVKKDEILACIKNCWKSLYDGNVVAYNDTAETCSMNVIIQEMIDADYSGVAFSRDLSSSTGNYSIIEATSGLGEQLVSGIVTPTRFLVRRQTGRCDLLLGEIKLSEEIIKELENTILEIEKLYGFSVDVEWCILNNCIYILQARPITAFNNTKIMFEKTIAREKSLIEIEIYSIGEYEGIKSLTRNLYYFKPLFIYDKGKSIVNVYYNIFDLEEDPNSIYYFMNLDLEKTKTLYNNAVANCRCLNEIINDDRKFDYKDFIKMMIEIYPFSSLGNLAGRFENIADELKELLIEFRNNYDYVLYAADEYLLKKAKELLPDEYKPYLNFLLIEEVFENKLPTIASVKERMEGYVYFGKKLELTKDFKDWLDTNNFAIKEDEKQSLVKGSSAYNGIITGRVCLIFNKDDFKKVEDGDVLVTPMTTPKFTPILKKASAIVTDEGGITCHAAIIARELKVPCVVGCKNATVALKDGMMVEVDADNGIVYVIE